MNNRNKQIVRNTITLYIRMVFLMVLNFFSIRVLLKQLGVEDYGLYNAIGGVVLSLSFISNVLASASQRYFAFELGKGNKNTINKIYSTLIITYVGISACILVLALTFGEWFIMNKMNFPKEQTTAVYWVFYFSLFAFLVTMVGIPFQTMLIANEDMNHYASISILDGILKLAIVYLLTLSPVSKLTTYALLWFIVIVITNSLYVIICKLKYKDTCKFIGFDKLTFKSLFSYSTWTLFGTIAGMLNTQGLNILLNVYFGVIANAAFAITRQIYSAIVTLASSSFTAIRPQLIKSYAGGEQRRMLSLFYVGTKATYSLLIIIFIPALFDLKWLLTIWLGETNDYIVTFSFLMIIYTFVLCLSTPITTLAQAQGNVKIYNGIVDSFTMLSFPISYGFYKLGYVAEIGYIILIIVFIVAHFLRLFILKYLINFSISEYLKKTMLPMVIALICGCLLCKSIKSIFVPELFLEHVFQFILLCFMQALILFYIVLTNNERTMIKQMLHTIRKNI